MLHTCTTCRSRLDQFGHCSKCSTAKWKTRAEDVAGETRQREIAAEEDEIGRRLDEMLVRELSNPAGAARAAARLLARADNRKSVQDFVDAWQAQVAGYVHPADPNNPALLAANMLHQLLTLNGLAA